MLVGWPCLIFASGTGGPRCGHTMSPDTDCLATLGILIALASEVAVALALVLWCVIDSCCHLTRVLSCSIALPPSAPKEIANVSEDMNGHNVSLFDCGDALSPEPDDESCEACACACIDQPCASLVGLDLGASGGPSPGKVY